MWGLKIYGELFCLSTIHQMMGVSTLTLAPGAGQSLPATANDSLQDMIHLQFQQLNQKIARSKSLWCAEVARTQTRPHLGLYGFWAKCPGAVTCYPPIPSSPYRGAIRPHWTTTRLQLFSITLNSILIKGYSIKILRRAKFCMTGDWVSGTYILAT